MTSVPSVSFLPLLFMSKSVSTTTRLGCFGHYLPFRTESVCRAPCLRPFLSPSPCLGKSSVKECLVMCSRPRVRSSFRERERERSLPGLPANVCHRFIVKLSSVQLTVDESNPLGKTHNNSNPHKTPTKPVTWRDHMEVSSSELYLCLLTQNKHGTKDTRHFVVWVEA